MFDNNCLPGTYYSPKFSSCQQCPAGSYSSSTGSTYTCKNLPNNSTESTDRKDFICNAGYYRSDDSCRQCPSGSYCPAGSNEPKKCPKDPNGSFLIPTFDKGKCCYNTDVIYKLHDYSGLRQYDLPFDTGNNNFIFPCCNGLNTDPKAVVNFPYNSQYPGWTGIKCNAPPVTEN
jgi:hypothetical protein